MKTSTGFSLTLRISDIGEYGKPSIAYDDIETDEPLEPQLAKQREIASAMLDDQLKLLVSKLEAVSSKAISPGVLGILTDMANKIQELENGLNSVTQEVSAGKTRKKTRGPKSDGDGTGSGS